MSGMMVHIPTPGDHYSPATGSAVITVINGMARAHAATGGTTRVIVSRGTTEGYPPYPDGECIEVDMPPALPGNNRRLMDIALGRTFCWRPFVNSCYRGSLQAIPTGFAGPVFVHNNPGPIPMLRKCLPRARLCLWAHNELFKTYSDRELAGVIAATTHVICVSEFIASGVRRRLRNRPDLQARIRVVLNGVDTERLYPATAPPCGRPPVILFLGRMLPPKGPDLLIKAGLGLKERGLEFRIRIIGSTNFSATAPISAYEAEIRELARPLGDWAEFRPFLDRGHVLEEFHGAIIFCVPSNWDEPFGLTVLEGLACGLPTVVSRRGGIPEAAGDAVLYFDPPDAEALAKQLESLIRDPEGCRRLGAAGRLRAEQSTWGVRYEQLVAALGE